MLFTLNSSVLKNNSHITVTNQLVSSLLRVMFAITLTFSLSTLFGFCLTL